MKTFNRALAAFAIAGLAAAALTGCDALNENSADGFGDCELTGEAGSIKLETKDPEVLNVTTVLPSNGWWNGESPDSVNSGFEYCMVANIAHRGGLKSVKITHQSWDQYISASNQDYDLSLASTTITEERKQVFDFSEPYFQSNLGVAVKKGNDVTAGNISQKKIGVLQGNMGAQFTTDTLKPKGGPQLFQTETEMFTALKAGQVDAVVTDTTLALTNTSASNGELEVIAQYEMDQGYGVTFPKGSANVEPVNEAIQQMTNDGTLDKLSETYLKPLFGADPNEIPVWERS